MDSNLESIKELEQELVRVRLTITEKQQEIEKISKTNEFFNYAWGFFGFLTLLSFGLENKLIAIIPGIIAGISLFFSFKNSSKISRLNDQINQQKKKKKQLEREIKGLFDFAKVKGEK